MAVTIIDSLHALPADVWDSLLPNPQPFLRHAFLSALEDSGSVGGRSGWQPSHRLWCDEQGALQAAMPAYLKLHSYGEYVFDHAWADACTELGLVHKRTRPYRPQTNGKIERFHRTMADGWAFRRLFLSESARRKALPGWLHEYNHHRPHTACGNQPPFSRLINVPDQYN